MDFNYYKKEDSDTNGNNFIGEVYALNKVIQVQNYVLGRNRE